MTATTDAQGITRPDPLADLALNNITEKLTRAMAILRRDDAANVTQTELDRLRTLLDGAHDQADAWQAQREILARIGGHSTSAAVSPDPAAHTTGVDPDDASNAASSSVGRAADTRTAAETPEAAQLSSDRALAVHATVARPAQPSDATMLTRDGNRPRSEFLLIPFGEVIVERPVSGDSFVFTQRHAASAVAWFRRMSRRLAIDYEHQSFGRINTRADGLRPAAGWIGGLEVRDDGLWAVDVSWTERARALLASGEYRYFSPVIYWTDEDYTDVAALGPVALTNDPAMHGVPALAANRQAAAEPGDAEDSRATTVATGHDEGHSLRAAHDEITLLRRQLATQEAEAFIERGMRLGKILDSTAIDWRDDYLRDPDAAEQRLQRAPVVLPPGRFTRSDRHLGSPAGSEGRDTTRLAQLGIEPDDLEAYERAYNAGRVRTYGER